MVNARAYVLGWIAFVVIIVAGARPALGHHSFAMFDTGNPITLAGVVTGFEWTNPHSYIELDVPDGRNGVKHWTIRARKHQHPDARRVEVQHAEERRLGNRRGQSSEEWRSRQPPEPDYLVRWPRARKRRTGWCWTRRTATGGNSGALAEVKEPASMPNAQCRNRSQPTVR